MEAREKDVFQSLPEAKRQFVGLAHKKSLTLAQSFATRTLRFYVDKTGIPQRFGRSM